VHIKERQTMLR